MKKVYFTLALGILFNFSVYSQIITLTPQFATQDDMITIVYDASEGNGELAGQTQIYAHTGVITNLSSSGTDWRHVQGNWGTADANVQMTSLGNDLHQIQYTPSSFYSLDPGEEVEKLAFVFRTADGSLVGRAADGGDIFVDIFPPGTFVAVFDQPTEDFQIVDPNDQITVSASSSEVADLTLTLDGNVIATETNATSINHTIDASLYGLGRFDVELSADNGTDIATDEFSYIAQGGAPVAVSPAGIVDGINYIDDQTVTLQFYAPGKGFAYLIGDFNNWELDPQYYMNRTPSGERFWITINNLTPGQEYRFQYVVSDELIRIADWYADKILDPWNDIWIDDATYPNLLAYPDGFTTQPVSVFQTAQTPYNWQNNGYDRPAQDELVIYELLLRDFTEGHTYQDIIDSLDYFERLGINAIQLMPFNEFEGNESWGYNPSFYFAPDKYYGPKDLLKDFIDECHGRGIAVIMDMVLNHSFGQSPMVRLYFDASAGQFGQPTPQNPWFNETPTHDFNVGYDFDHEKVVTQEFVDRVLEYWTTEYQIDGYRFDLSKGFTQNVTIGNIGAWNAYDASRVALLNRMAGEIQAVDPDVYLILEHFADNNEEMELANNGFMLWGNMNHAFNEATMGYSSDLTGTDYGARGWNDPHLVAFMESHDEERLQYKNGQFGNANTTIGYDVTEKWQGLRRNEAAAALFFSLPGPRMIWQFGEYGYDFSINRCEDGTIDPDCRLANKPIRWDYLEDNDRKRLFDVYAALINLRNDEEAFKTTDYSFDLNPVVKTVHLNGNNMDVAVAANMNISYVDVAPNFQHTGTWYDYFSGEAIEVTDVAQTFSYAPGEYHVYTDVQLNTPEVNTGTDELIGDQLQVSVYPNPARDLVTFRYTAKAAGSLNLIVTDMLGNRVHAQNVSTAAGAGSFDWDAQELPTGIYLYELHGADLHENGKLVLSR